MKIRGDYAKLSELSENLHIDAMAESLSYCRRVDKGQGRPEPQLDEEGHYIETDWYK